MTITERTVWLTFEEVIAFNIPEDTIKSGMARNRTGNSSWENKADPQDARRKLINYDSIPASTIRKYGIPDRNTLMLKAKKSQYNLAKDRLRALHTLEVSHQDSAWYQERGMSGMEAAGLAASAAWLRLLTTIKGKQSVRAMDIPGIESKQELLALALEMISDPEDSSDPPYGLHRVTNLRVLQRYMTAWKNGQTEAGKRSSILHGMTGKKNALKRTPESERALMSLFVNCEGDTKLNYIQVHEEYSRMVGCRFLDTETQEVYSRLPELSISTVKSYLGRPEMQALGLMRHGSKYYRDFLRPYILGRPAQYALSLSSSDGFVMPFWTKDSRGKSSWKRLLCYVVFDVASQAIIGASLGMAEDKESMRQAFLDLAVRQDNYMPIQNQLDNFAKFYEQELEQIMMVKFCAPYNAQSKYAETFIGRFKEQVLRRYSGYIGRHSLTHKNRRNEDKENPQSGDVGYTLEETQALLQEAIDTWNNSPAKARGNKVRAEILSERKNPDAKQTTHLQVAMALGERTKATIDRGFIKVIRHGQERVYRVPEYGDMLSKIDRRDLTVRVRYLDHLLDGDHDSIWIFNYSTDDNPAEDRMICECPREVGTQRAGVEQTESDRRNLGTQLRWRKEYEEKVSTLLDDIPARLVPLDLTPEEAETMLAAGYSKKPAMMTAEETVGKVKLPPAKSLNIDPNIRFKR